MIFRLFAALAALAMAPGAVPASQEPPIGMWVSKSVSTPALTGTIVLSREG